MRGIRVTKIVKEINFEGVWGELESKKDSKRQPFIVKRQKDFRLTLVFMSNSALREKFNFYFPRVFASINRKFGKASKSLKIL